MADTRGSEDFHTTQWSQVELAGGDDSPQRRAALAGLLTRYLPALRSHLVRRYRIDPERAEDMLQEFVVRKVYDYNLFGRADRERGKFRTLLLTGLDNFAWDRLKRENKARGAAEVPEPVADSPGPEIFFDVPWARQVLAQALAAMQEDCRVQNRLDVWGIFEARMLRPILDGVEPVSYEQLTKQFALESIAQTANRLVTAKRMFERQMREVIAQYSREEEIDEEIADLRRILAAAGRRASEASP